MEIKKKTFDEKTYKIINGDSLQVLDTLEENSIDAIITDPPYELGFMGKGWDKSGIAYNVELWKKALRVLKSGGYLLAFGGSRTFHRIACAIEDAGFEIRDTIMWLYGSGFPKSLNIGLAIDKKNGVNNTTGNIVKGMGNNNTYSMKNGLGKTQEFSNEYQERKATNKWSGWGTSLKPAFEPIIVARKPCEGSCIENIIKYGVGGINIDECRIPLEDNYQYKEANRKPRNQNTVFDNNHSGFKSENNTTSSADPNGRFPANVILTYDKNDYNEVCGNMPESNGSQGKPFKANDYEEHNTATNFTRGDFVPYNDNGSASRYFYCAKASRKDRDDGLVFFENKPLFVANNEHGNLGAMYIKKAGGQIGDEKLRKNIHPTVKPVELMQYLVRLVSPKGATIMDIFNGSGSTGKAVMFENRERNADYKYIGIELDPEYCKISESRIDFALNKYKYDIAEEIKENEKKGQLSLFEDYEFEE